MISIGIMAVTVVITHLVMGALSTWTKSEILVRQRPKSVRSDSVQEME